MIGLKDLKPQVYMVDNSEELDLDLDELDDDGMANLINALQQILGRNGENLHSK
jgi:hypothetical protein